MKKFLAAVIVSYAGFVHSAPSVDPLLRSAVDAAPLSPHPVVITYGAKPTSSDLAALRLIGITDGWVLQQLPIVLARANAAQLSTLQKKSNIASLYGNRIMKPLTNASREFIGQAALQRDDEVRAANGGLPVSGKGIGVAVVDTGLDATHGDHQLGNNVRQNVYFALGDLHPALCTVTGELGLCPDIPVGLVPPLYAEDQPMTDYEGGHGTFVTGVIGGTGNHSGGFYGGVAPGADLIGLIAGNDLGLTYFSILQAYDWILVNQWRYNIRVANNSFGSDLGPADNYDPMDPINVGTRAMHDRFIAVVYAAGNSGDVPGAINRLAVAPWVISVASGMKEGLGTPSSFSSRGWDNGSGVESAPHPADPFQAPNLRPDITAPGEDIKSTRSKGPGVTNLAGTALLQDLDVPPAYLPFYTTSQGTSFSAPHIAGVAALMLEVDPMLTPQRIMQILRATAMPMPFEERVVGAGMVDAHNAVRMAMGLAAVEPPVDLIPGPDTPTIIDARNDQIGTLAQDIVSGEFGYDADSHSLVYSLEVADMDERTPNSRWTQSSVFDGIRVFVSTNVSETGAVTHTYGTIAPDPDTGINTQTNLGPTDAGAIDGNTISVALSFERINAAVGFDAYGRVSTAPQAQAQILIGTSATGGLLLNADSASGRDYVAGGEAATDEEGDGNGGDDTTVAADCAGPGLREVFAGVTEPGFETGIAFNVACDSLTAHLSYQPGNLGLTLSLLDSAGAVVAHAAAANGRRLSIEGLAAGTYQLRINGEAGTADYAVKVRQRTP
ncbi:MAG: S8 family serine peptidase [Gammaproteobacteria bacterium]